MMNWISKIQAAVGLGLAALSVPASAAVFDLTDNVSHVSGNDAGGNYMIFTANDGTQARVTAWTLDGNTVTRATLGDYDQGLGVTAAGDNGGANNLHTVDNRGTTDFLVFQFSSDIVTQSVKLTPFAIPQTVNSRGQITSTSSDTDATIRFGDTTLNWNSYINYALSGGLSNFGTNNNVYSNTGNAVTQSIVNPDPAGGNLLFVSASLANTDLKYDGSKVSQLNFVRGAVPEPASWAMMIAGFGLVGGAMRRQKIREAFAVA